MAKPPVSRKRISADIPAHILVMLDAIASRNGLNRTAMLTVLINREYDNVHTSYDDGED